MAGLVRRAGRKSRGKDQENGISPSAVREEIEQMAAAFYQRAAELGHGNIRNYWWYHTIDLGNGLITPGVYDYRSTLSAFNFPDDMTGMDVLDIGSATGFFAFEFEKRGANVTSVEIPSITDLDRFYDESLEQALKKIKKMLPHS